MRRRIVLAAALEVVIIAFIGGMFAFSVYMAQQEKAWRDQGVVIGPVETVAVDVSMWWLKYWWTAVPLFILGGLVMAAVIVFTGWPASSERVRA